MIEPLVPMFDDGVDQPSVGDEKRSSDTTGSSLPLSYSFADEVHYFTWDIEQIEPLVPIMTSGGAEPE